MPRKVRELEMFIGYDKNGNEVARVPLAGQRVVMEKARGGIAYWREATPEVVMDNPRAGINDRANEPEENDV